MGAIALISGDPADERTHPGGASFSRFVLPFAYRRCASAQARGDDVAYRPAVLAHGAARRRYLTPETADVLFSRALWLECATPAPARVVDRQLPNGHTVAMVECNPTLVLFEWSTAHPDQAEGEGTERRDVLQSGFLLLDVFFPAAATPGTTAPTLDDLLHINELFRYWQRPFEGHARRSGHDVFFDEDASPDGHARYFERWARWLDRAVVVDTDSQAWRLYPTAWGDTARAWLADPAAPDLGWIAYPDDRTFVWTCALTARGAQAEHDGTWPPWARLLNVDRPGQASAFEASWAEERTYRRWEHYGTRYGMCAHGGAMLAAPCDEPPIVRHFRENYFDQVLLLLYLRVSTFRFSRELSRISADARDQRGPGQRPFEDALCERFHELRASFALFTNLYRFPLLSIQQQGVELFALALQYLDVQELFDEVQAEVHAIDEYLGSRTQLEHAATATRLSVVAGIGVPVSLALAYLQVSGIKLEWPGVGVIACAIVLLLLPLPFLLLSQRIARRFARWERCLDSWLRHRRRGKP